MMKWQDIIKTRKTPYEREIEERIKRTKKDTGFREKRGTAALHRKGIPGTIGPRTGVGAKRDEARVTAYFSQLENILDGLNVTKDVYIHFVDQVLGRNPTGQRQRALQEYAAGLQETELNLDALDFLYEAIELFELIPTVTFMGGKQRGHVDLVSGAQIQRQEWPQEYQQYIQDITEEE